MWVLKRTNSTGGYVALPGHRSSYTPNLMYAKKYRTKEEAIRYSCPENEIPVDLFNVKV
jgi:hypothetical protein